MIWRTWAGIPSRSRTHQLGRLREGGHGEIDVVAAIARPGERLSEIVGQRGQRRVDGHWKQLSSNDFGRIPRGRAARARRCKPCPMMSRP
jgi:hypothetical protein